MEKDLKEKFPLREDIDGCSSQEGLQKYIIRMNDPKQPQLAS